MSPAPESATSSPRKVGTTEFFATDPKSGRTWEVHSRDYLSGRQNRKMKTRPDMILQFSHFLADDFKRKGHKNTEIRVYSLISLNGRELSSMINPKIDLSKEEFSLFKSSSWILPLEDTRK